MQARVTTPKVPVGSTSDACNRRAPRAVVIVLVPGDELLAVFRYIGELLAPVTTLALVAVVHGLPLRLALLPFITRTPEPRRACAAP